MLKSADRLSDPLVRIYIIATALIFKDLVVNVLADEVEEIGQLEIIPVFGAVFFDQDMPNPALRGTVSQISETCRAVFIF